MVRQTIPFSRVPKSTALFLDYLYHFDRVRRFYTGSPFDLAGYKDLAKQLGNLSNSRKELADILTKQNQSFGASEPTFENLRRLAEPGTFAVVTGQQVGLLSGPAFTLYKALTAVRLAQALSEQGLPSVPVFWLATEDHDLEEVSATAILDEDYHLVVLKDAGERPAPRSPVGRVRFTAGIENLLRQFADSTPPGAPRDRLMADLAASYQPGLTWGEGFARLMSRLFARWGVVLLDALDEGIHRLAAPVYRQALTGAGNLREQLSRRSEALVRSGYHAQVHVREDSTLLFVTEAGNRSALSQRDGGFYLDERQPISLSELEARVKDQPLDFTPNALLRPIVQDTLLPTVAYVAGPSELAYVGQSQAIYQAFGRPQPILFPRSEFTLVDRRVERLLEKYGVGVEDVWQGEEHLSRKIAENGFASGWAQRFEQTEKSLGDLLERLRHDVETLDPTLLDSVRHAEEKMRYQVERLKGKITRAAFEKSELLSRHRQALSRFIAPGKSLQERQVSGIYFLGRAGYELLDRLLGEIRIDGSEHGVVTY